LKSTIPLKKTTGFLSDERERKKGSFKGGKEELISGDKRRRKGSVCNGVQERRP